MRYLPICFLALIPVLSSCSENSVPKLMIRVDEKTESNDTWQVESRRDALDRFHKTEEETKFCTPAYWAWQLQLAITRDDCLQAQNLVKVILEKQKPDGDWGIGTDWTKTEIDFKTRTAEDSDCWEVAEVTNALLDYSEKFKDPSVLPQTRKAAEFLKKSIRTVNGSPYLPHMPACNDLLQPHSTINAALVFSRIRGFEKTAHALVKSGLAMNGKRIILSRGNQKLSSPIAGDEINDYEKIQIGFYLAQMNDPRGQEILDRYPNADDVNHSRGACYLVLAHARLGQIDKAVHIAQQIRSFKPDKGFEYALKDFVNYINSLENGYSDWSAIMMDTHRVPDYDFKNTPFTPEELSKIDLVTSTFYGNIGLFRRWNKLEQAENRRFPQTVNTVFSVTPKPNDRYYNSIATDLPGDPLVMIWPPYSGDHFFPHGFGGSWMDLYIGLDTYAEVYWLTKDQKYLDRLIEFADFVVWSQYDEKGKNQFLEQLGISYDQEPDYAGGWPTHDFEWKDAYGYVEPKYEPSHHIDAHTAFSLVKAYEATGNQKYLDAAELFVIKQMPFYGIHKGMWNGKETVWTGYNPAPPRGSPDDAVTNVNTCCSLVVAAVAHHKKDQKWLKIAHGLVNLACKEWVERQYWYYYPKESSLKKYQNIKAGELAVLVFGVMTLPYLEASGIDVQDIRQVYAEAAAFYYPHYRDTGFAHAFCTVVPAKEKGSWDALTTIRLFDSRVKKLSLVSQTPGSEPVPAKISTSQDEYEKPVEISLSPNQPVPLGEKPFGSRYFRIRYPLGNNIPEALPVSRLELLAEIYDPCMKTNREIKVSIPVEVPPEGHVQELNPELTSNFKPWFLPRVPPEKK